MPPHEMPEELKKAFTMNGRIKTATSYVDDTNEGKGSHYKADKKEVKALVKNFRRMRDGAQQKMTLKWEWLFDALKTYPVRGQRVAVFGSMEPSIEALLVAYGAEEVTTIDYNKVTFKHKRLKQALVSEVGKEEKGGYFDVAVSLSSFDHDGLGRYGDPIDPDGDLKAMHLVRHLLKPEGILLLTVPVGPDIVVWNLHRRYGKVRLPKLLEGWKVLQRWGWDEEVLVRKADYKKSYEPLQALQHNASNAVIHEEL